MFTMIMVWCSPCSAHKSSRPVNHSTHWLWAWPTLPLTSFLKLYTLRHFISLCESCLSVRTSRDKVIRYSPDCLTLKITEHHVLCFPRKRRCTLTLLHDDHTKSGVNVVVKETFVERWRFGGKASATIMEEIYKGVYPWTMRVDWC